MTKEKLEKANYIVIRLKKMYEYRKLLEQCDDHLKLEVSILGVNHNHYRLNEEVIKFFINDFHSNIAKLEKELDDL